MVKKRGVCMLTFHSFLQTVFQFVKSLAITITKKMYRYAAVLITGAAVVMVVTLTANGFGGGGKSALVAYAEPMSQEEPLTEEPASEETELITEAKVPLILTDSESSKQGQLLAGSLLVKEAQDRMANQLEMLEEIGRNQEEIRRIKEETLEAETLKASAIINFSEKDYDVLLRIVEAEAGICDEKGRILVANVIINRINSSEFPDTVTDVVYQKSQFSPVTDGRLDSCTITDETIECVNRALAGEDYSQGALYFMNRNRSKSHNVSWFDNNLTYLFHHDKHDFFR